MSTLTATTTDRLRAIIDEELPDLIDIRHDLHAHPELMYKESRTSSVVRDQLQKAGVEFVGDLAGGTGVLGHLPGESAAAIGLRADMDALPIIEETGVPYASTHEGVMHACGHDGHTTILIGAARVLARLSKEAPLPRPVSFLFQPAEEGGAGGRRMVEDGCLSGKVIGPPMERMFGLHGWPKHPLGTIGTRVGPLLAAADMFEIRVRGTGGHAAFPQMNCDPIIAGSAIVSAIQTIASRNVDPLDSIVVSITQFHGGTAHNIIVDEITLGGTVRTLHKATQALARRRLEEIAGRVADGFGCTATLDYHVGYPVTCNDATAVAEFESVVLDGMDASKLVTVDQPVMGAEDFSFYCEEIPSCFFVLGLLPEGEETMPQLHQPTFNFNDEAIQLGVETFCRLALRSA